MTAFKSVSRHLRDALIEVLQGIQYDAGSGPEQAFQLVDGNPSDEFDQEPYALVYPADLINTKSQTGEQDRNLQFEIFLLLKLENGLNADSSARTQEQTYDYMYDLAELVLNALDEADWNDTLHSDDVTIVNWILNASRGTFLPAKMKAGAVLVCTIHVSVEYSFDL